MADPSTANSQPADAQQNKIPDGPPHLPPLPSPHIASPHVAHCTLSASSLLLSLCVARSDTDFQQQRLKAWQPALTPRWVVTVFVVLGVIFIPIGAALVYAASTVHENSVRYDNLPQCALNAPCNVTITVSHDMSPPIFFYYKLSNFYQNHRRYVSSQSVYQLHGDDNPSDLSSCSPDRWEYYYPPPSQSVRQTIYPCGAIAGSFFNDTFTASLIPASSPSSQPILLGGPDSDPDSRQWEKSSIAYSGDSTKYQVNTNTLQQLDDNARDNNNTEGQFSRVGPLGFVLPLPNDTDFQVWQRVAALPTFKKLYRIIRCVPSSPGQSCSDSSGKLYTGDQLTVQVANNFNIDPYSGQKWVVLSTVSWLGGRNFFLGAAWITVGGLCFLLALIFGLKTLLDPPRVDQRVFSVPGGGQLQLHDTGRPGTDGQQ